MQNEKNRLMQAKLDAAKGKRHHVGLDSRWKVRRPMDDVPLKTVKLMAEKENIPKKAPIKVVFFCNLAKCFSAVGCGSFYQLECIQYTFMLHISSLSINMYPGQTDYQYLVSGLIIGYGWW